LKIRTVRQVLLGATAFLCLPWGLLAATPEAYSLHNRFGLSVSVAPEVGQYWVAYKGHPWLGRGIVSVLVKKRWYRSAGI